MAFSWQNKPSNEGQFKLNTITELREAIEGVYNKYSCTEAFSLNVNYTVTSSCSTNYTSNCSSYKGDHLNSVRSSTNSSFDQDYSTDNWDHYKGGGCEHCSYDCSSKDSTNM